MHILSITKNKNGIKWFTKKTKITNKIKSDFFYLIKHIQFNIKKNKIISFLIIKHSDLNKYTLN